MMAISNTQANLINSVARFKGERDNKLAEIARIEAGLESLAELRERVTRLDVLIASAEMIVQEENPDWSSEKVQPRRTTDRHSPIPYGMLGRTALEVLRDAPPEGLPAREVARDALRRLGFDTEDRAILDKRTNSIAGYFKANEGDLVQSDGAQFYKRWSLIRENETST